MEYSRTRLCIYYKLLQYLRHRLLVDQCLKPEIRTGSIGMFCFFKFSIPTYNVYGGVPVDLPHFIDFKINDYRQHSRWKIRKSWESRDRRFATNSGKTDRDSGDTVYTFGPHYCLCRSVFCIVGIFLIEPYCKNATHAK